MGRASIDLVAFFSLFGTVEDGKIQTEAVQRASAELEVQRRRVLRRSQGAGPAAWGV